MATGQSLGRQSVDEIATIWQVDPVRSIRRENGFDWWPGDFHVSVTAFPREDDQQTDGALLWVQTDFLTDVPIGDEKFVNLAAATSRFCTSTYAWAYRPAEIWSEFAKADDRPKLCLANTAYVRADNVNWMPAFLARMSIMQSINAQLQAANMQNLIGGVADVSRLADLSVGGLDDMLEVAAQVYVPVGNEANRWIGTGEFEQIETQWGQSDVSFGFGDAHGLTLETPLACNSPIAFLRRSEGHRERVCVLELLRASELDRYSVVWMLAPSRFSRQSRMSRLYLLCAERSLPTGYCNKHGSLVTRTSSLG